MNTIDKCPGITASEAAIAEGLQMLAWKERLYRKKAFQTQCRGLAATRRALAELETAGIRDAVADEASTKTDLRRDDRQHQTEK